jgi:hypothetical protein
MYEDASFWRRHPGVAEASFRLQSQADHSAREAALRGRFGAFLSGKTLECGSLLSVRGGSVGAGSNHGRKGMTRMTGQMPTQWPVAALARRRSGRWSAALHRGSGLRRAGPADRHRIDGGGRLHVELNLSRHDVPLPARSRQQSPPAGMRYRGRAARDQSQLASRKVSVCRLARRHHGGQSRIGNRHGRLLCLGQFGGGRGPPAQQLLMEDRGEAGTLGGSHGRPCRSARCADSTGDCSLTAWVFYVRQAGNRFGFLRGIRLLLPSAPRAGPVARPAPRGGSSKVAEPHLLERNDAGSAALSTVTS